MSTPDTASFFVPAAMACPGPRHSGPNMQVRIGTERPGNKKRRSELVFSYMFSSRNFTDPSAVGAVLITARFLYSIGQASGHRPRPQAEMFAVTVLSLV